MNGRDSFMHLSSSFITCLPYGEQKSNQNIQRCPMPMGLMLKELLVSKNQNNDERIIGMRHLPSKNQNQFIQRCPIPMGLMLKELLACAT